MKRAEGGKVFITEIKSTVRKGMSIQRRIPTVGETSVNVASAIGNER